MGATKTVEILLCGNFLSVRSFLIEKMIKFHPHGSRKKGTFTEKALLLKKVPLLKNPSTKKHKVGKFVEH